MRARTGVMVVLAALAAGIAPACAGTAPANNFRELFAALDRCAADSPPASGTDVTLVFMLNRRGGLIGKPRLTHAVWPPGADPREAAAGIAASLGRCLPFNITDSLGGAIAGRLIAYRLRWGPSEQKT